MPKAFVVRAPGSVTAEEVHAFVAERVAPHKKIRPSAPTSPESSACQRPRRAHRRGGPQPGRPGARQQRARGRDLVAGRRVRGLRVRQGRARQGRRGRGRHRRRRGQPRDLTAGQAGVRRASGRRPRQQPRRTSGCSTPPGVSTSRCRPRTCSPRWSRKPCRSAASCASSPSRAAGPALSEVTLAPNSPAEGNEMQELGLPRDSTVVAILRQDRVVVPRGDTVL